MGLSRCFFAFFAVLALLPLAPVAQSAPRIPTDPAEVLERLPLRPGDATARELATLRAAVATTPSDPVAASALADRYYDLAIAKGDPRYIGYADALMRPFKESTQPAVLAIRGQLKQYRHDFGGALKDFEAALQGDPTFASAHAWRGAIFMVQADYAAAKRECAALQALKRATLASACLGLATAYSGDLEVATNLLQQALKGATDAGNRLWLLTRLGEVAAWRGRAAEAEKHYRAALALNIEDGYLLAAWTDFLLDEKRYDEVVTQLKGWESSDGLLLRLAIAETALKLPSATAHTKALADRFAAAKLRGDTTHRAEESRFALQLAGNPALALTMATENYREQKEPRDARALLEAAIAANKPDAAAPVRAWLQASGFQDARLKQLAATGAKP